MIDRRVYTTAVLSELPTLAVGQEADLKVEIVLSDGVPARLWLSRCGLEDGEPWQNTVTLEVCREGRWKTELVWNGDDPVEVRVISCPW